MTNEMQIHSAVHTPEPCKNEYNLLFSKIQYIFILYLYSGYVYLVAVR